VKNERKQLHIFPFRTKENKIGEHVW